MSSLQNPPDASGENLPQPNISHGDGLPVTFSLEPLSEFDPESVVVVPVQPVDERYGRFGGRALALRNVLTPSECQYLISAMTSHGHLEQVSYRRDYRRNDRCVFESSELAELLWRRVEAVASTLAVVADAAEPAKQRLLGRSGAEEGEVHEEHEDEESSDCPEELRLGYGFEGLWRPVGLNECLRFCRYNPGGFFRPHCDAVFQRSEEERSLFTCMFYLDGGMEGGATRFLDISGALTSENHLRLAAEDQVLASLAPEAGQCLLFFQPGLLHEGEDVREGSKHILRTDVMFKRDAGTGPRRTPREQEAWRLAQEAQAAEAACECDRACQLYRRAFKMDPKLERLF